MGGVVGSNSNRADLGELVGSPECRLHWREPGAVSEEDAGVDPVPHRGVRAASEGAHAPHHAAVQAPCRRDGIRCIERPDADQQAGADHESGRLRRGRVDQARQR